MGIKAEGEGVFINNVPMQDIHFVVHKSINGFVDEPNWKIVPRTVNHDGSIREGRFIINFNWEICHFAIGNFVLIAGD
jgi:hypothetical protein